MVDIQLERKRKISTINRKKKIIGIKKVYLKLLSAPISVLVYYMDTEFCISYCLVCFIFYFSFLIDIILE